MEFLGHSIEKPGYVPVTAWLRHGPFAIWLTKAARPARIVELGSHFGYSYFSFCQAVSAADLPTKCFAVDTWQGDEHAGFYDDSVYQDVVAENAQYSDFSTLIRKTFDEAREDIADGSVDLLHVDGRHFYDDVKEDFESWIPKLSDRAIVLFHDTEVRDRGFGVSKYWDELTQKHQGFNFPYQHGLGVLFWGEDLTPEMVQFRELVRNPIGAEAVTTIFHALGQEMAGVTDTGMFAPKTQEDKAQTPAPENAADGAPDIAVRDPVNDLTPDSLKLAQAFVEAFILNYDQELLINDLAAQISTHKNAIDNAHQVTVALERQANAALLALQPTQLELIRARSRPMKTLRAYMKYKALDTLSKWSPPIPADVARRFARSAAKRNPTRAMADGVYLPGTQPVLDAPTLSNCTTRFPGQVKRDPQLPDILIVTHDCTRTGAPILALNLVQDFAKRYNVTTLCLRGGELLQDFQAHSVAVWQADHPMGKDQFYAAVMDEITPDQSFDFAVVNSIESRYMLLPCQQRSIPTVSLLHEFASYTKPFTAFTYAVQLSSETVFSTKLTFDNAVDTNFLTRTPSMHVLPQGKCIVPTPAREDGLAQAERNKLQRVFRPEGHHEKRFVVLGAGYAYYRKGTDLFIDTAMRVLRSPQGKNAVFIWIGAGYKPDTDDYSGYLFDQLRRAGISERVLFLPETSEIETAYALADVLILTSRLDPLPNVAIDAMCAGLPVVCFDDTTGIAEVLTDAGLQDHCVADYLDTGDMADKLLAFVASPDLHKEIGEKTRAFAQQAFDFPAYARRIEDLAIKAKDKVSAIDAYAEVILDSGHLDTSFALGRSGDDRTAALSYLQSIRTGVCPRKPEPGFHPFVYARAMADDLRPGMDPYTEFLRQGRPEGPWLLPVIRGGKSPEPGGGGAMTDLRVALQIHAFYTDKLSDIVDRLDRNKAQPDLFISVGDSNAALYAEKLLENYSGKVVAIETFPNVGRDIGPLLTGFGPRLIADYDVIGHIHTKKSLHVGQGDMIDKWVEFTYSNVLGGKKSGPMLDRILAMMQQDKDIGIVYPDDPNIIGWTNNLRPAQRLAQKLNLDTLPDVFNFPVGTMFLMRTAAFKPFVDLGLTWADYPAEPVPIDGTMLHALERLFGVVPAQTGWKTVVTATSGLTR